MVHSLSCHKRECNIPRCSTSQVVIICRSRAYMYCSYVSCMHFPVSPKSLTTKSKTPVAMHNVKTIHKNSYFIALPP
jgi:hypothetical protein